MLLTYFKRNGELTARRKMARSPREHGARPDEVSSRRQGRLCAGQGTVWAGLRSMCFFHVSKEYRENIRRISSDGLKS